MIKVNVIAMEYPGYGIFAGEPSEKEILINTLAVYDFLTID